MDNAYLAYLIGSSIISIIILYLIISTATRANARYKIEYAQMVLLAEMARKQGVDEKFIEDVLTNAK